MKVLFEVEYGGDPKAKPLLFTGDRNIHPILDRGEDQITFNVSGETIKAHKIILARSTYFANMFASEMNETHTNEIDVPDASPKAFQAMIVYLFGGFAPFDLDEMRLDLFAVADKYGIDNLRDMCLFSIFRSLDAKTVVDTLLLAERYNLEELMSQAKLVLKANISAVEQSRRNREKLKEDPDFLFKLFVELVGQ